MDTNQAEQLKAQIKATLEVALAVGRVIQSIGSIPSGELYAMVMSRLTLDQYTAIIRWLKEGGMVRESNYLLTWTGPPCKEKPESN
jgi:hypothetical protein